MVNLFVFKISKVFIQISLSSFFSSFFLKNVLILVITRNNNLKQFSFPRKQQMLILNFRLNFHSKNYLSKDKITNY